MITKEQELDLELEIYKLNGVKNLLNAWAESDSGFEAAIISNELNKITTKIFDILSLEI